MDLVWTCCTPDTEIIDFLHINYKSTLVDEKVISLTLIIARVNAYRTHGCSLSGLDKIALTFNCQWLILALASEGVIGCCPMKIYVNLTEIPSKKWGIN